MMKQERPMQSFYLYSLLLLDLLVASEDSAIDAQDQRKSDRKEEGGA